MSLGRLLAGLGRGRNAQRTREARQRRLLRCIEPLESRLMLSVMDPTLVTTMGGWVNDVTVVENRAYLCMGDRLTILDVSTPAAPVLRGQVDVADPEAPVLVGNFDTTQTVDAVSVQGAYAYLANSYSGVQVVDVSNPATPTRVGGYLTANPAQDIVVAGAHAYVADTRGFRIINIQNPASPYLVGGYEARSTHSIRVRLADKDGFWTERVFTIGVTNVQEAPTDVLISGTSIMPGQPANTPIGTFSTIDPDGGGSFTYALVAGAGSSGNASFKIVGNELRSMGPFNYATQNSYSIRVRSTDSTGLWVEKVFTINVINQSPPADILLSPASVPENRPAGTVVGVFTSIDPDPEPDQTFTYALVAGTGSTNNGSFEIVGDMLRTKTSFNFEYKSSYTIRVRSTDQTGLWMEKVILVSVTNVNEAPTAVNLSNATILENRPVGTVVGTLSTIDPDSGDTFTYSLSGMDDWAFRIVGNQLQSNTVFNYEAKNKYDIMVTSRDAGGLGYLVFLTIHIMDAPEPPTFLGLYGASLAGKVAVGTAVGSMHTTDPDAGSSFTYTLVGGEGAEHNALFKIAGNQLQAAVPFDIQERRTYSIRIRSTDQTGLWIERSFIIGAAPGQALSPVGSLTGVFQNLDVDGSYAYLVADAAGLVVVDVSNPAAPARVGSYDTPGTAYAVSVANGYAYIADHDRGLQIVDVRSPTALKFVGTFDTPGLAYDITVVGAYAYVADDTQGLHIFDVSNPAQPRRVGGFAIPFARAVQVVGHYAYVGDNGTGLWIVDVRNPAKPTLVGRSALGEWLNVRTVSVVGDRAYLTANGGLHIIDLSDPTAPVRIVPQSEPSLTAWGSAVSGSLAYVASGTLGLIAVDVSDPLYRVQVGACDTPGTAINVAVAGRYAYVADGAGGLQIIRLATDAGRRPTDLHLSSSSIAENLPAGSVVGLLNTTDPDADDAFSYILAPGPGSADNARFEIVGNELRAAVPLDYEEKSSHSIRVRSTDRDGRWIEKVFRVDVLDVLEYPHRVGQYDTSGFAWNVALSNAYAYIADGHMGLHILDVSDPAAPVRVGGHFSGGHASGVVVAGPYAYVADGHAGLQILDISDPAAPRWLGAYPTAGNAWNVTVAGSLAFIADDFAGLQIVDVSNPAAPVEVGRYLHPVAGSVQGVAVAGAYAYVAGGNPGLLILDISNPAVPTLVGFYDTAGSAADVVLSGPYAYVADRHGGLHILDIADPAAPTLVGGYDTPGDALRLVLQDGLVYIADGGSFQIIDVSEPAAPARVGAHLTTSHTLGLTVRGSFAYVAEWNTGLHIFRLTPDDLDPPTSPGPIRLVNDTGASDADGITRETALVFAWMPAADNGSGVAGYEYRLNGGPWMSASAEQAALTAGHGEHHLAVRALDRAGNRGTARTWSFTVDTQTPVAPVDLRLEGRTLQWEIPHDSSGTWKSQVRIDGGEWRDVFGDSLPLEAVDWFDVAVRTVDIAGNAGDEATGRFFINIEPTATFGNGGAVREGSAGLVRFSNPHDSPLDLAAGFRYSYDFDDDGVFDLVDVLESSATVPAGFFADGPGIRTVRGRIIDQHGTYSDYRTSIPILNVAPVILVTMHIKAVAGMSFVASGSFHDPSPVDKHSALVNYGDGKGYRPLQLRPDRTFDLRHTYARPGRYDIRVKVMDDDGGVGVATIKVTVSNRQANGAEKAQAPVVIAPFIPDLPPQAPAPVQAPPGKSNDAPGKDPADLKDKQEVIDTPGKKPDSPGNAPAVPPGQAKKGG